VDASERDDAAVGVIPDRVADMGEDGIVVVDLDDAGREDEVPRNRRESEREEALKERSGVWVDVEREGAREEGKEEELFVVVDEVDRAVLCLGGDVDADDSVGDSE
jgi:hypothetical protein